MEKVSIIIPCYNAEKTLTGTINSVREQNYSNLEIILVNDGSKDSTLDIANHFASIDERIKVINQVNGGVSVARNNGLLSSTGEYIMYLDADDNYTTPYAISNMLKRLKDTDADMCVCNFTHPCFEQHLEDGIYDLTKDDDFIKYYQDFFASSMPWNKITKRECITEIFTPGLTYGEDELYNLRNLKNLKKVVVTNEVYHNYYCAPFVPCADASAITTAFRDCKDTVWHTFMKNQPLRESAIKEFFPEKEKEMSHVRSYDFFYWVFFLMAKNHVPEGMLIQSYKSIFNEKLFQDSLKDKEIYGVKFKEFTNENIEKFCKLAYRAFIDIKSYNKKFSMYKIFTCLFSHFFCDEGDNLNTCDMLAYCCEQMETIECPEAYYVKCILDINEESGIKCAIHMFDSNISKWCIKDAE